MRRDSGALAREIDAIRQGGSMPIQPRSTPATTPSVWTAICIGPSSCSANMLFHSRFAQEDVELERGVILSEIGMCEDTPEDLVLERLIAAVYQGAPLSHPTLAKHLP